MPSIRPIVVTRLKCARSACTWRNLSRSSSARLSSVTSSCVPTTSTSSPPALRTGWPNPCVFDRSVGQHDSELDNVVSFFAQRLLGAFEHLVAILWMDPLQDGLPIRKTLLRIEAPNSEIFL